MPYLVAIAGISIRFFQEEGGKPFPLLAMNISNNGLSVLSEYILSSVRFFCLNAYSEHEGYFLFADTLPLALVCICRYCTCGGKLHF